MWRHEVGKDWLDARRNYLTSTDIKGLLPFTKTGRPRKVTKDDYAKLILDKQRVVRPEERLSTGMAARGHILEPYAIARYNQLVINGNLKKHFGREFPKMYHWDDTLIHSPSCLAFSPDGMCVPQAGVYKQPDLGVINFGLDEVEAIIEVKSYGPAAFYDALNADADKLEERWQLATAMAVLPSCSLAVLAIYNPSFQQQLGIRWFDNHMLADEIGQVLDISKTYNEVARDMVGASISSQPSCYVASFDADEEEIYKEWEDKASLDPPVR